MGPMYRRIHISAATKTLIVIAMALIGITATAQLEIGDSLKMTMNGDLGYGFNGGFGNTELSSAHSQSFVGDANLDGYYFHPNFLSFNFRPYFNRSQNNTTSQSI